MSASSTKLSSTIAIKFKTGVDTVGNDIIKTQNLSKVKVGTMDDDILAVGTAVGALLKYPVTEIHRNDEWLIVNS